MSDLSLTILAETTNDAQAIERLHERTFGPGRFVLSAYRLREHVDHVLDLSFTARIGTLLVGSVRQLPVCIGDTRALLLGPLTVEPPFRSRGVGRALLDRALRTPRRRDIASCCWSAMRPITAGSASRPSRRDGRACRARSITAASW
jgi:predicted N-acetyltransferase YhbS